MSLFYKPDSYLLPITKPSHIGEKSMSVSPMIASTSKFTEPKDAYNLANVRNSSPDLAHIVPGSNAYPGKDMIRNAS